MAVFYSWVLVYLGLAEHLAGLHIPGSCLKGVMRGGGTPAWPLQPADKGGGCCRAEQLRQRLTTLLCSQFEVVQKRTRKANPVAFLRIRSFNGRTARRQLPEFMAHRANSDSRLTTEAPRTSINTCELPFRSNTVTRFSSIMGPDREDGATLGVADTSVAGGTVIPSEQRSLVSSTPFLSRSPSQVLPEFTRDSCTVSVPETDADASAKVRHTCLRGWPLWLWHLQSRRAWERTAHRSVLLPALRGCLP